MRGFTEIPLPEAIVPGMTNLLALLCSMFGNKHQHFIVYVTIMHCNHTHGRVWHCVSFHIHHSSSLCYSLIRHLIEVSYKALSSLVRLKTVNAGICATNKRKPLIVFRSFYIWDIKHISWIPFLPTFCPLHLPAAIFTSSHLDSAECTTPGWCNQESEVRWRCFALFFLLVPGPHRLS